MPRGANNSLWRRTRSTQTPQGVTLQLLLKLSWQPLPGGQCLSWTAHTKLSTSISWQTALPLPPCGSLFPEDDGRHILAFTEFNFSKKLNIMCSFDRKSMKCRCCASRVLGPMNSSCKFERRTFVLCDQNFPAVLPAGGDKQCIKILRVENGSLWEIFGVYAEMMRE